MSIHLKGSDRPWSNGRSFRGNVGLKMPVGKPRNSWCIESVKPRARASNQRRLTAVCAALLLLQMILPARLMAQAAPSGNNLDLTSKDRTVAVSNQPGFQPTNIRVGRQNMTVNTGDMLTPAEYAALQQVLTTGTQTLRVGVNGNAVRGTLNLTPAMTNVLEGLVIPNRVTVVNDFGLGSSLNISGNLTNSGKFYAVSSNSAVTNAIINANNIFNNQGALLTSVLPAGGLSGFPPLAGGLNLTLNAANNVVNAGVISSAGHLNVNAGGSIVNQATMTAVQNVNLMSAVGSITNSGLIAAIAGNINIATQTAQNIAINNVGGVMQ